MTYRHGLYYGRGSHARWWSERSAAGWYFAGPQADAAKQDIRASLRPFPSRSRKSSRRPSL